MSEDIYAQMEITPREVSERLARGEQFLFVDVREKWEHETARIEMATLIPMREIPANLSRLEPAALNGHKSLAGEAERHVCHVLHARRDMSVPLAVHRGGKFVENMENDRDVVRRQVPGDVNVFLE